MAKKSDNKMGRNSLAPADRKAEKKRSGKKNRGSAKQNLKKYCG